MTPPAITVRGLTKQFGEQVVLDDLDLDVAAGTVFALLGPNGAGKTTTVRILATQLRPDAGEVCVAGYDPSTDADAVRAAIGVTGQFAAIDPLLTGAENLQLMADLHRLRRAEGRARVQHLLQRFDLLDAADKRASTYSGGMRRRLDIAMSMVGEPRIVFLDEPTTGLDPRSRRGMWRIVDELVAEGVTVLLTTQYLEEADELADRIAVLDGGRLIAEGTADELKSRVPGGHVRFEFADLDTLGAAAHAVPAAARDEATLALQVPSDGSVGSIRALLDRFDDDRIAIERLSIHTPDLDDVFFALTQEVSPR